MENINLVIAILALMGWFHEVSNPGTAWMLPTGLFIGWTVAQVMTTALL